MTMLINDGNDIDLKNDDDDDDDVVDDDDSGYLDDNIDNDVTDIMYLQ